MILIRNDNKYAVRKNLDSGQKELGLQIERWRKVSKQTNGTLLWDMRKLKAVSNHKTQQTCLLESSKHQSSFESFLSMDVSIEEVSPSYRENR